VGAGADRASSRGQRPRLQDACLDWFIEVNVPLELPVFSLEYESFSHRILANVLPLSAIRLPGSQHVVEEPLLPGRRSANETLGDKAFGCPFLL
jgi:hypothetical protein